MTLDQSLNSYAQKKKNRDEPPKACFDDIYIQEDPREYFRVLYGLDYIIPDLARGIFANLVAALEERRGHPLKVLDLGCSYGINAILLRTPLDLARLAQRYSNLAAHDLSPEECADLDRRYFQAWPRQPMTILGLDSSASAVSYAKRVGVIDDGLALDLETRPLSRAGREMLRDVDLIISTGCVGYVTERTFAQILETIDGPMPWVASFVLRMYPYTAIAGELRRKGLVTEKLEGATFTQRRFHSEQECRQVLSCLDEIGISTRGKEAEGLLQAEFHLSRSPADIAAIPLEQVANVTTGEGHAFGRRYRRIADDTLVLER
jgi:SAM-dependent methyltransferase